MQADHNEYCYTRSEPPNNPTVNLDKTKVGHLNRLFTTMDYTDSIGGAQTRHYLCFDMLSVLQVLNTICNETTAYNYTKYVY